MRHTLYIPLLLLAACGSHLSTPSEERQKSVALEEVRQEVAEMRHQLSASRMELQLLDERVRSSESSFGVLRKDVGSRTQVESIDQRMKELKSTQEHLIADVKQLAGHLQTVRERVESHEDRLAKVGELRKTLSKMAQVSSGSGGAYVVKSGDSLEKIARAHGTTVDEIKRLNVRLGSRKNDQILVGEELVIRSE